MQKRYKGLSNIGATCYMNSLLQTLFMTPEFRYGIYKWKYNEKIHPKQIDSIIFQLQKLFAKLQTGFPKEVSTKQLVKSFQWQDQQAQMQQDIQQFNRLLFQALQKSLSTKSEKYIHQNFVKDLFQGQLIHYTKCYQCQNQSTKEEYFQDVIITVKNIYEKVYNCTLQLGIQRYLKPQILDENNLYDCQNCGKKTKAQRGARFTTMPFLLNIIFQRFTFNYYTMQRQKVNDKVEFPFVLNFNDYINGYQHIPHKISEESAAYFKNICINGINAKPSLNKLSTANKTTKVQLQKKSAIPAVAGKTKTKPSANTKSFLAEMRKRKNVNSQQNQDQFYVNGNGISSDCKNENTNLNQQIKQSVDNIVQKVQRQLQSAQRPSSINCESQLLVNDYVKQDGIDKVQLVSDKENVIPDSLPIPPPLNICPGDISIPFRKVQTTSQTIQSELQKKQVESEKLQQQKQKQLQQIQQRNKQRTQEYLKQGPLVYQLYAVLVHNGTANHGHYYSYIKSFQDQKWYCFNDQRVSMINVLQIEKTFGNGNSNAYALYYRMVDQETNSSGTGYRAKLRQQIPEYIREKLNSQQTQIKQKEQLKIDNLDNLIILKIYYQLYVKQLQIYKANTLELALERACNIFGIPAQVRRKNRRLRIFNPASQAKLQTFGGRQNLTLEQLKIGSYKNLLLQLKKDQDEFQEYEIGAVSIRIALIQQNRNLNSLDESYLNLHKIKIRKNLTICDITGLIGQKRQVILHKHQQQTTQCVSLIKRHHNNDQSICQFINIKGNWNKTMEQLNILQNQILFVQPEKQVSQWAVQFQNQIYRITIKYNRPGTVEFNTYLTDSRISVLELKKQLCTFLEVNPEDIIMKLGTKSGRELKDLSTSLKEARFITGTPIYFDFGIPAKSGQIRILLYLATEAAPLSFNRLHQFQYLTDVPISGSWKASQVKQKFVKVVKKLKDIQLKPWQFRIRERVSDKIGKIYRQRPMKEQQLIEKRQIAIEVVPDQNLDIKQFAIYFRIWDQLNWQLSKKIQLIINKNSTMKDVAQILSVQQANRTVKQAGEMSICRILSIHKFNIIDLTQMEWFSMNQDAPVIGQPMFVNADGLLYIIKNGSEEPRQLSKDEQKMFGGSVKPAIIRNKPRTYQPKQAKSMKIKVIQKQQEPDQNNASSSPQEVKEDSQ